MLITRRGFMGGVLATCGAAALRLHVAGRRLLTAAGIGGWEMPMQIPVAVAHGTPMPVPTNTPTATATSTATATPTATATSTPTPTPAPVFRQYLPVVGGGRDD